MPWRKQLTKDGELFSDMDWFFKDRNITNKGHSIAQRLKSDFSLDSDEWRRWTTKTSLYNATSLTQVFGEYFRDFSVGDNGGIDVKDSNYVSKPGYPGTLAPGLNFEQDASIESLPKRILHPWPAMQEIKSHGRNPPCHPMVPPPLLWFALNDMYTQNFTEWQLSKPSEETVGGYMMEPKDAIRIVRNHIIGRSYVPEDQIAHGGLQFPGGIGGQVPNYNPDHGPTVSVEEAVPPIPDQLRSVTERWLDPYYNLDTTFTKSILTAEEQEQAREEETSRRVAAEAKLAQYDRVVLPPMEQPYLPGIEPEVSMLYKRRLNESTALYYDKIVRGDGGEVKMTEKEAEQALRDESFDLEQVLSEEVQRREESVKHLNNRLDEVAAGSTRGRKQLTAYAIETIRDMQSEIFRAERDMATKRRAGRRKQRKNVVEAEDFISSGNVDDSEPTS